MIYPLIGARLHGWLDDLFVLVYLAGAVVLGLDGAPLALVLGGSVVHFALTRLTDYPQGTFKIIPFRAHAFIELAEGLVLLAGSAFLAGRAPAEVRLFLVFMGVSQLLAFAFSDYRDSASRRSR